MGWNRDQYNKNRCGRREAPHPCFDPLFGIKKNIAFLNENINHLQEAVRDNSDEIANKVNKESGKGLSTNDFTDAEKEKLDGIEAGAQKNPDLSPYALKSEIPSVSGFATKAELEQGLSDKQATLTTTQLAAVDSGVTSATVEQVEANKIAIGQKVDKDGDKVLSDNNFTDEDKTKLDSINLEPYAKTADVIPRYGTVNTTIADSTLTLTSYSRNALTSDGTAFTVAMGGDNTHLRDCVFVVTAGNVAPKITWGVEGGPKFSPRTDSATDMEILAGVTKVFWVTEYAPDQFAVAGWEVVL